MKRRNRLVLIGGGMLAGLLYEMFRRTHNIAGYIDDIHEQGYVEKKYGLKSLGRSRKLGELARQGMQGVIAITDVAARKKYADLAGEAGLPLATLVSDTALVSESAVLGPGCIIRHRAIVSSQAVIGANSVVSDNAYIGHDSIVGCNAYISPAAALNGCVFIGDNAFVGTGAVVLPRVKVGAGSVVGAAACVTRDVPPGSRVAGVPAENLDPLVSVTLASYNHRPYIREAVESVLSQNYGNFELIISDDASSDGTAEEIRKFTDPRIHTHFFRENQGIISNKRKCLEMASGKYIAILNSDDAFMPGKLEAQVVYLDEHPEAGAVLTGVAVIDENGDPLHDSGSFYFNIFEQPNRTRREWLRHFFYFGNCLCIPSAMIRRECYDRIGVPDRRFHQLPDWDFWVKLCFEYEMYILPEILTRFRVMKDHGNASGRRPEAEIRSYWEFLQVLRNYLRISSVYELQLIFPEAAEIIGPDGSCEEELIPFVLAQLALRKNDERWSFFALQVLFELMGDEKKAEKLKRRFGFSYRNLIGLTGKIDCFHLRDRMASPVPAEGAAE